MMKKVILYITCALLLFTSNGCKENLEIDDNNVTLSLKANYLAISQNQFDISSDAQSFDANVTTISTPWAFSDLTEWISANPQSGQNSQNVTFKASTNPSGYQSRTTIFYLNSENPSWTFRSPISVSQSAANPYVRSNETQLNFNGNGGTQEIQIETNTRPNITYSYGDDTWLKANLVKGGSSLEITASESQLSSSRTGYVYLNAGYNSTVTITVTQQPPTLTTDTTSLVFDNTASTYKLAVKSEASWTASTTDSWIQVSPTSGKSGTSEMEISVAPNTSVDMREGHVKVSIGSSINVDITVYQRGIYIDAEGNLLLMHANGETRDITVKSNTNWTATSDESWIKFSPVNGSGETKMTVTVSDNPSLSRRTGHINFVSAASNISESKTVIQEGKTFSVDTTLVNISDKGGTASVNISSDGPWTATPDGNYDWLTFTPMSGNGNSELLITAKENNTTEERIGYINLSMYDKTYQIGVHQYSKYFNVKSDALKFASHGGTSLVEVSSNDEWSTKVQDGNPWLSVAKSSGQGSSSFNVEISDNASTFSRSAFVDIESKNSGKVRLNYEQAGRYLTVDRSDFTFFAGGGTSTLTTINTDGTFKISQEGGWFSINKLSDNTFTVTASENDSQTERNGSIIIELTELKSGSAKVILPLRQVANGATFTLDDYTTDRNWNLFEGHNASITVKGYASDKNWNVENTSVGTISFSNFGNDKNWNENHKSNSNTTKDNYGDDKNWNDGHNSSSNITGTGYGSDTNWNNN